MVTSGVDGRKRRCWVEGMAKFAGYLLLVMLALALGGTAFLAVWDIPPPTAQVERTLPDDRFPR